MPTQPTQPNPPSQPQKSGWLQELKMTLITTLAYAALTAHLILDKAGLDPRDLPRRVRYAWLRARIKLGV